TCVIPAVSSNRMEYRVFDEDSDLRISTVARSGFRSPSKSAMAKFEFRTEGEPWTSGTGLSAACVWLASPDKQSKGIHARRMATAPNRWVCSFNSIAVTTIAKIQRQWPEI